MCREEGGLRTASHVTPPPPPGADVNTELQGGFWLEGRIERRNQAVALAFVPPTPFHSQNDSSTFDFNKEITFTSKYIFTYSKNITVPAS